MDRAQHAIAAVVAIVTVEVCLGGKAPEAADPPNPTFAERLLAAAMQRLDHQVVYDGSDRKIDDPSGDVPEGIGVCTDLVVRAYRVLGIDLQRLVHEDMTAAFDAYARPWGLCRPDPNIDQRRVLNLRVFFARPGASLPVTSNPGDGRLGDMVPWMLPGNRPHIGIVAARRSADAARPLIVHDIGAGLALGDVLFAYPITGHYRHDGPR